MNYLILIIVAVAGIALGAYFSRRRSIKSARRANGSFTPKQADELSEIRKEAHEALTGRTEKRKEKILHLMNSEVVHQKELKACGVTDLKKGITSRNVEKLLDVSGGTARKYLNELESENKITQVGKTGRDVYYTLTSSFTQN